MCGFIGGTVADWNYDAGLQSIVHRGPDSGHLLRDRVNLGFRRLAIIDLDRSADQPMTSSDGQITLVFNGEIYGFTQIRAQLANAGFQFRTQSDTEVVLVAYQHWGDAFIEHIDGMFAIAIFDRTLQKLKLWRDRPGIKPLYYYFDGTEFAFASELKAIEATLPPNLLNYDPSALYDFLGYRYVPAPKTLYRNCFKLEPAHSVVYDLQTRRLTAPSAYWRLPVEPNEVHRSVELACEELRSLIDRSVRKQIIADVPVGFFLSGGVDSSVVVKTASEITDSVKTFSIGFDSDAVSETPFARKVALQCRTDHHERILTRESAQELLPKLKAWFDEPFADESAMPTYLVSKTAREHVTVVLTGDGGDEVFGGYRTYPRYQRYSRWPNWPAFMEKASYRLRSGIHRRSSRARLLQLLEMGMSNGTALWAKIMGGMPTVAKEKYRQLFEIPEDYDDWWHFSAHWRADLPIRTRLQYLDFHTFMPGLVLTKVDRTSMAVSLEARVPFLDKEVIEFAFSLPESIRLCDNEPKGLLRAAYRDRLPADVIDRRKKGFGIPRYYLGDVGHGVPIQEHILRSQYLNRH